MRAAVPAPQAAAQRPRCCAPPPRIWHRVVTPAIDGPHQGGQCHSEHTIIEEATDALVKTAGEAASDVPVSGVFDEAAAQRIRSLNKQVLARASAAGTGAVDGNERALQDMADFETKIAGSSQLDWLQAVVGSHTKFVTALVSMYANAIRSGLSG